MNEGVDKALRGPRWFNLSALFLVRVLILVIIATAILRIAACAVAVIK
jgi:hypothetical protein